MHPGNRGSTPRRSTPYSSRSARGKRMLVLACRHCRGEFLSRSERSTKASRDAAPGGLDVGCNPMGVGSIPTGVFAGRLPVRTTFNHVTVRAKPSLAGICSDFWPDCQSGVHPLEVEVRVQFPPRRSWTRSVTAARQNLSVILRWANCFLEGRLPAWSPCSTDGCGFESRSFR